MRESGLEKFVREHQLTHQNVPLSELRTYPNSSEVRLGVDGHLLLDQWTRKVWSEDPLAVFTSAAPASIVMDGLPTLMQTLEAVQQYLLLPPTTTSAKGAGEVEERTSPSSSHKNDEKTTATDTPAQSTTGASFSWLSSSSNADRPRPINGGSSTPAIPLPVVPTSTSLGGNESTAELCRSLRPVLVFGGISYIPGMEPHPLERLCDPRYLYEANKVMEGGELHFQHHTLSAEVKEKSTYRFFVDETLESWIVWASKMNIRDVFRAPYFAWTQLASFFLPSNLYLSDVYGCLELLAFPGVERVITNIHLDTMTFDYVVKDEVWNTIQGVAQSVLLQSSWPGSLPDSERDRRANGGTSPSTVEESGFPLSSSNCPPPLLRSVPEQKTPVGPHEKEEPSSGALIGCNVEFDLIAFQEWILMDSRHIPFMLDFIPSDLEKVLQLGMQLASMAAAGHTTTTAGDATPTVEVPPVPLGMQPPARSLSQKGMPPTTTATTNGNGNAAGMSRSASSYGLPRFSSTTGPSPALMGSKRLTEWILLGSNPQQARRLLCNLAVLDAPVLTMDGHVLPLSVLSDSPRHNTILPLFHIIGDPLPSELYFMLSIGLVMPSVIASVGQHFVVARKPLNDSPLFRTVSQRLLGVRVFTAQALRVAASSVEEPFTGPIPAPVGGGAGRSESESPSSVGASKKPGVDKAGTGWLSTFLGQFHPRRDRLPLHPPPPVPAAASTSNAPAAPPSPLTTRSTSSSMTAGVAGRKGLLMFQPSFFRQECLAMNYPSRMTSFMEPNSQGFSDSHSQRENGAGGLPPSAMTSTFTSPSPSPLPDPAATSSGHSPLSVAPCMWTLSSLSSSIQHAVLSTSCTPLRQYPVRELSEQWPVCGDPWLAEVYERRAALLLATMTDAKGEPSSAPGPVVAVGPASSTAPLGTTPFYPSSLIANAASWSPAGKDAMDTGDAVGLPYARHRGTLEEAGVGGGRVGLGAGASDGMMLLGAPDASRYPTALPGTTEVSPAGVGGSSSTRNSNGDPFECFVPLRFSDILMFAALRLNDPDAQPVSDQVAYNAMTMMDVEFLPPRLQKQQHEKALRLLRGGASGGEKATDSDANLPHAPYMDPYAAPSSSTIPRGGGGGSGTVPTTSGESDWGLLPTSTSIPECCAMITLQALDSLGYFSHQHGEASPQGLSLWGRLLLYVGDDPDEMDYAAPAPDPGMMGIDGLSLPYGTGANVVPLAGSPHAALSHSGVGATGGFASDVGMTMGNSFPNNSSILSYHNSSSASLPASSTNRKSTVGGGQGANSSSTTTSLYPSMPFMGASNVMTQGLVDVNAAIPGSEEEVLARGYELMREGSRRDFRRFPDLVSLMAFRLPLPPRPVGWRSTSEYLLLLLDLLRSCALTDDPIPLSGTLKEERTYPTGLRLATRLFSILPITLRKPWKLEKQPSLGYPRPTSVTGTGSATTSTMATPTSFHTTGKKETETSRTTLLSTSLSSSHEEMRSEEKKKGNTGKESGTSEEGDAAGKGRPLMTGAGFGVTGSPSPSFSSSSFSPAFLFSSAYVGWTGPFDPELAAFHTVTRTLIHTLRETLEGMAVAHFASGRSLVPPSLWPIVVEQLPFQAPPHSFHAGTVLRHILLHHTAATTSAGAGSSDTSESHTSPLTMTELQRTFPDWIGGKADVWWWWMFWRKAMKLFYPPSKEAKGKAGSPTPSSIRPHHLPHGGTTNTSEMTLPSTANGDAFTSYRHLSLEGFTSTLPLLEVTYKELAQIFGEANMEKVRCADKLVDAALRSLLFYS